MQVLFLINTNLDLNGTVQLMAIISVTFNIAKKGRQFEYITCIEVEIVIFQILWKSRCDIFVTFPSHLKKLRSILRSWLEKLNCGFFHSFHSCNTIVWMWYNKWQNIIHNKVKIIFMWNQRKLWAILLLDTYDKEFLHIFYVKPM